MADIKEVKAVETQASVCCGGPAPKDSDACCAQDAQAKAAGETGSACCEPAPAASCCAS